MPPVAELQDMLTAWMLGSARVLAVFSMLPFFGRQNSAPVLRAAIAAAFALPALPLVLAQYSASPVESGWLLLLIVKEGAIGLLLGIPVAIPFWAAEAVGFVISNQSGAAMAGTINTMTGNDSSALAILVNQAYIVLFLLLGGVNLVLGMIYDSYAAWPVTGFLPQFAPEFAKYGLGLLDTLMHLTVTVAAPVMIAMLLAELGLGLVSLFAPQMQVFFLAMPVKGAIALFVLAMYFGTLLDYFGRTVTKIPATLEVLKGLLR